MAITTGTQTTLQTNPTAPVKGDIITTLNYFREPHVGSRGFTAGTAGFHRRKHNAVQSVVHDVRGREDEFKLDIQGFEFHHWKSAVTDFRDDEEVKRVYYKEVEEFVKKLTGATRVHTWSHMKRLHGPVELAAKLSEINDDNESVGMIPPSHHVHIDQSYVGAPKMIARYLPEDTLKTRHQIINVWRPLRTVHRDALALGDARSIAEEDLVRQVAIISGGREMDLFGVTPPEANGETNMQERHNWYWASEMSEEECWVFRIYDSNQVEGRARRCPHTAITIPGTTNETETRQSIEVRCAVLCEDEPAT